MHQMPFDQQGLRPPYRGCLLHRAEVNNCLGAAGSEVGNLSEKANFQLRSNCPM